VYVPSTASAVGPPLPSGVALDGTAPGVLGAAGDLPEHATSAVAARVATTRPAMFRCGIVTLFVRGVSKPCQIWVPAACHMSFDETERAELIAALSRTAEIVGLLLDALYVLLVSYVAGQQPSAGGRGAADRALGAMAATTREAPLTAGWPDD
jgi:hypothetical protein